MQTLLNSHTMSLPPISNTQSYIDMSDEVLEDPTPENFIPLSSSNKSRLYSPWTYSIIVKVFGRKVGHLSLKQKLQAMWKPTETLSLIDLGNDFFLIKYQNEENMNKALHEGPWFVLNHLLLVRCWEPQFVASTPQLTYTVIWTRLWSYQQSSMTQRSYKKWKTN